MPASAGARAWLMPIACLALLSGLASAFLTPIGPAALWQATGLLVALVAGGPIVILIVRRRWPPLAAVALVAAGLGLWRGAAVATSAPEPWVGAPEGTLRARVSIETAVETRGAQAIAAARIVAVEHPLGLARPEGLIQITTSPIPSFDLGDQLDLRGRVDPADRSTPYGRWLLGQGIVATARFPDLLPAGRADLPPLRAAVHGLRRALTEALERAIPQPHAALIAGLTLGVPGLMPESFRQALATSGTSHIMVVSGYNVSVVGGMLAGLVRGRRAAALAVPLLGILGYTLLVGATPPAVRAALMAAPALLAAHTGRRADSMTALGLAVATMCVVDPTLLGHLGFQLSVLATLGLITLQPRLSALAPWFHPALREPVATSVAAGLTTAPVLMATFHQVPLAAPLANALIAPLVPVLTVAGMVGAPILLAVPAAAASVGLALGVIAQAVVTLVELCAAIPGAAVPVGSVATPLALCYVLGLGVWAACATAEGRDLRAALRTAPWGRPLAALGLMAAAAMLVAGSVGSAPPPLLSVTLLDVGHADALLVRTPAGRTVLIDGGPTPAALLGHLGRRLGLLEHDLSVAILTRADADRLPAAVAAVERYPPSLTLSPPEGSTLALYERWTRAGRSQQQVVAPLEIELEPGLAVDVAPTSPLPGVGRDGALRRGLATRIAYGAIAILVAPALTADAAAQLAATGWPLRADILVVPRHGHESALDRRMLDAVRPSAAILAVGSRNRDGLPAPTTLALLSDIPVHRTDLHGSIEFRTDGTHLWIERER